MSLFIIEFDDSEYTPYFHGALHCGEPITLKGMLVKGRLENAHPSQYRDLMNDMVRNHEMTTYPNPIYDRVFECMLCGYLAPSGAPHYCPNCGAKIIRNGNKS